MQLSKPKLFPETKGFIKVMAFLLVLIMLRLLIHYQAYQSFIHKPFYYTYVTVMVAYKKTKNNREYQVLKVKSDEGLHFYTVTHLKKDLNHYRLRLEIFPNGGLSFIDYLGTFYINSKIKKEERIPISMKERLLEKIAMQHHSVSMQHFYQAIFLATSIDKDLRQSIALLGVSHLVALSGFHLGILWGLVYGGLLLLYRPLQQKFFPYRHALLDMGFVAMLLLGFYVWFVGLPPSLLRSYAMVLVGWVVLLLGMELLSFTFLTTIVLSLSLLFPSLLVSLSFWFSVSGVFYIFLILHYSKNFPLLWVSFFINFGIFVLMLPVVHSIFEVTSLYQLLSPLLSLAFIVFYPLGMLLHLLGYGDVFDTLLLALFALPQSHYASGLSLWLLLPYIALSLGAIFSKKLWIALLLSAGLYLLYLFAFVE